MKDIEEMDLKEKDRLLKGIFREYQKAKLQLEVLEDKEFYPQLRYDIVREGRQNYNNVEQSMLDYLEKKKELKTIVDFVEGVVESLPDDLLFFIENDYLMAFNKNWWMEYYSRATYYRIRRKAIEDVLFYLIK